MLERVRSDLKPDTPLILNDLKRLILPLQLADGRTCLPLSLGHSKDLRLYSQLLSSSESIQILSARPVAILGEPTKLIEGEILQPISCQDPFEIGFSNQKVLYYLYELDSSLHPLAREEVAVGDLVIPGIVEEGFYPQEWEKGKPFRWTSGQASLKFSLIDRKIESLSVILERPVVPYQIQIQLNGEVLLSETIEETRSIKNLELPSGLKKGKKLFIKVHCSTFRAPKDPRELGVRPRFLISTTEP